MKLPALPPFPAVAARRLSGPLTRVFRAVEPALARLSPRERRLALLTAGVVFVLGNILVLSYLLGARRELSTTLEAKRQAARNADLLRAEAPTWQNREAWLKTHQPKLAVSPQAAGGQLLVQVQQLAAERRVTLEAGQIVPPENPNAPGAAGRPYQPVAVVFNARGDWGAMINFLAALQADPEGFLVPENLSLHSDKNNPALLTAESVRVARWFAPAGS